MDVPFFAYHLIGDPSVADRAQGGRFEYTADGYLRYVLAVVSDDNGRYLMLKNVKLGGRWQCPGGKIDKGETARFALAREIREELGCNVSIGRSLLTQRRYAGGTLWQGEYFACQLAGNPSRQEPHKHEAMGWVRLEAASAAPFFTLTTTSAEPPHTDQVAVPKSECFGPITETFTLDETFDAASLYNVKHNKNLSIYNRPLVFLTHSTNPDLAFHRQFNSQAVDEFEFTNGLRVFAQTELLQELHMIGARRLWTHQAGQGFGLSLEDSKPTLFEAPGRP